LGGLLKCARGNLIFLPADPQERAGKQPFATPELENRLAWKKMNSMPECLSPPKQTVFNNRIVILPVIVSISFPNG
jgi:hypothetical protein